MLQDNQSSLSTGEIILPALIERAGARARRRFLEFFTANIRNPHTRRAYAHAVGQFLLWCEERGLDLERLEPMLIAAYIEKLGKKSSPATVKQHLAAIRMLLDYLVTGQVLPFNPAAAVRGPKHVVKEGKTPVLFEDDARKLFQSIDISHVVGLRDRALIGVMIYSFARVGAVVKMRVKDYYTQGKRSWFVLHEKGGRFNRVPGHHKAVEYLDAYIAVAGIAGAKKSPLFRAAAGKKRQLTDRPLSSRVVLAMVKRRVAGAGLPPEISNHTFRATGITNYLANGGTIETAARIAGHASTRTTQLYNRAREQLRLDEIERIQI